MYKKKPLYKIVEAINKVYTIIKKCENRWEQGNFAEGVLSRKLVRQIQKMSKYLISHDITWHLYNKKMKIRNIKIIWNRVKMNK